jgi:hypothetical protein
MSSNCFKTIIFYLLWHMSCLLICKNINSAYLKGENMLMNVFNTNIYFTYFISIYLCLNLKININLWKISTLYINTTKTYDIISKI